MLPWAIHGNQFIVYFNRSLEENAFKSAKQNPLNFSEINTWWLCHHKEKEIIGSQRVHTYVLGVMFCGVLYAKLLNSWIRPWNVGLKSFSKTFISQRKFKLKNPTRQMLIVGSNMTVMLDIHMFKRTYRNSNYIEIGSPN